jgi:hypothetical protein
VRIKGDKRIYVPGRGYFTKGTMIAKIKVPKKVYDELVVVNREIHYTLDYSLVIKKAEDYGLPHAAEWLRTNEQLYKMGFARGFEPE